MMVWAATSHVIRDRGAIEVTGDKEMVPAGAHLANGPLGGEVYILGFTASDGAMGSMRSPDGARPHPISILSWIATPASGPTPGRSITLSSTKAASAATGRIMRRWLVTRSADQRLE